MKVYLDEIKDLKINRKLNEVILKSIQNELSKNKSLHMNKFGCDFNLIVRGKTSEEADLIREEFWKTVAESTKLEYTLNSIENELIFFNKEKKKSATKSSNNNKREEQASGEKSRVRATTKRL